MLLIVQHSDISAFCPFGCVNTSTFALLIMYKTYQNLTYGLFDCSRTKKPMLRIFLPLLGFLPAPWQEESSQSVIPQCICDPHFGWNESADERMVLFADRAEVTEVLQCHVRAVSRAFSSLEAQ